MIEATLKVSRRVQFYTHINTVLSRNEETCIKTEEASRKKGRGKKGEGE